MNILPFIKKWRRWERLKKLLKEELVGKFFKRREAIRRLRNRVVLKSIWMRYRKKYLKDCISHKKLYDLAHGLSKKLSKRYPTS